MTTADIFNEGSYLTDPAGKKTFAMRQPSQEEQGQFQRWCEQEAHDAIDRSTGSEESKDRRHSFIDVAAGLGKYQYEGEYGYEARFLPAGMAKLISIVLRDQGVTEEKATDLVRHKFKELAAEYIGRKVANPKAMALVRQALGLLNAETPSSESEPSSKPSSTLPFPEPSPNSEVSPTSSCSSSTTSSEATAE